MYNHTAAARPETERRLAERTDSFAQSAEASDRDSLAAFREKWEPSAAQRLMAELPTCPFLGLVADPDSKRVGCLVHPLQNDGTDGRDAGVYDRFICEDYLCAAHQVLTRAEKWLVIEAIEDSYTYGLVITDPLFVRQLFERTAGLNAAYPGEVAIQRPGAREAARDYFALKSDWRWAASDGIFGQLQAGEGLETPRRPGPSEALGVEPDPNETILRCLGTQVTDVGELHEARQAVADAVQRFADAVAL